MTTLTAHMCVLNATCAAIAESLGPRERRPNSDGIDSGRTEKDYSSSGDLLEIGSTHKTWGATMTAKREHSLASRPQEANGEGKYHIRKQRQAKPNAKHEEHGKQAQTYPCDAKNANSGSQLNPATKTRQSTSDSANNANQLQQALPPRQDTRATTHK